jgi:hypothetical protein
MRLLIIGERLEQATNLGRLLHTLGHTPCVATEARVSDRSPSIPSLVCAFAPDAIVLDLPQATTAATALVSDLQVDRRTRGVPTVLLADGADDQKTGPWAALQGGRADGFRAIPYHGTSNAVDRLLGMLHDLQAEPARLS